MLSRYKKKIESVMYDSDSSDEGLTDAVLSGLSACYGKVMKLRERLYRNDIKKSGTLPCYVISVGNITVGGTGKTPMVIYLAGLIKKMGLTPAVVSRGYGGSSSSAGGIVCDGKALLMTSDMAGDEPYMIAEKLLPESVPVVIGSNRYQAGMTAVSIFNPDVIILDDGFQHLKLKRDLDILLFDSANPLGNGKVLPRGTLREPVAAMLRADIVVLTRVEKGGEQTAADMFYKAVSDYLSIDKLKDKPVFTSTHIPSVTGSLKPLSTVLTHSVELKNAPDVYAFSGIAKNHEFRKTVTAMGYEIKGYSDFQDHHVYTEEDCETLIASAKKNGATALITTEKDSVKLRDLDLDLELIIICIGIDFGSSEKAFRDLIKHKMVNIRGEE